MAKVTVLPPDETRLDWSEIRQRRVVKDHVRGTLYSRKSGRVTPKGLLVLGPNGLQNSTPAAVGFDEAKRGMTKPEWSNHADGGTDWESRGNPTLNVRYEYIPQRCVKRDPETGLIVEVVDGYQVQRFDVANHGVPLLHNVPSQTRADERDRAAREYDRGYNRAKRGSKRVKVKLSAETVNARVDERILRHDPEARDWWDQLPPSAKRELRTMFKTGHAEGQAKVRFRTPQPKEPESLLCAGDLRRSMTRSQRQRLVR